MNDAQDAENSQHSSGRRLSNSRSLPAMSSEADQSAAEQMSYGTSTSDLTSSDKLSALPIRSSPAVGRFRSPSRVRRSSSSISSSFDSPRPAQIATLPLPASASGTVVRGQSPDGSVGGRETPRQQRVSFESDRVSLPTLQSIRQAISSRVIHGSDPDGSFAGQQSPRARRNSGAESPSRSPSRATSPLRFLPWPNLHRAHSREEPFVPIDPFKLRFRLAHAVVHRHTATLDSDEIATCCLPLPCLTCTETDTSYRAYLGTVNIFIVDTLPRMIYLHLLLRLPSLYFTRVARIFEDAEVSRPDIQRMMEASGFRESAFRSTAAPTSAAGPGTTEGDVVTSHRAAATIRSNAVSTLPPAPEEWNPPSVSPALARFKRSWEEFIGSLLKEWKTLNVVSALLLTAILTMFQIPSAAADPLIRTAALISLVCALMSLSYGCIFIIRFGTMRSMYRASRWAEEAQKTKTSIWWNVWVMLAMPAVWLTWSMLSFIVSILGFVWRTGDSSDPDTRNSLSPTQELGPRIVITCLTLLGLLYFWKIIGTFKRYGSSGQRNANGIWSGGPYAGRETRGRGGDEDERRRRGQGPEIERQREAADRGRERRRPMTGLGLDLGSVSINLKGEKSNGEIANGPVRDDEVEKNEVVEFIKLAGSRPSSPKV